MTAASIDNDIDNNILQNNNDSIINKKRNKTQKRISSMDFNPNKVNSVLESIHNRLPDDDNESNYNSNGLNAPANHSENFTPLNPLAPPISVGTEKTKMSPYNQNQPASKKEGMANNDPPQPVEQYQMDLQELQSNFMNEDQMRDYYRKLMPNYSEKSYQHKYQGNQYLDNFSTQNMSNTNQVLIDKLNYMINLLEEQKDQRTNNVTEEVVLYSFLGVFIIFVVDSFARAGKYVR